MRAPQSSSTLAAGREALRQSYGTVRGAIHRSRGAAHASEIGILQQPASAGGRTFWPVPTGPRETLNLLFRVVAGARPVDEHDRLVADHPGVVAGRQGRDLARAGLELAAVRHDDV